MPKGSLFPKPGKLKVSFGPALTLDTDNLNKTACLIEAYKEKTEELKKKIIHLKKPQVNVEKSHDLSE